MATRSYAVGNTWTLLEAGPKVVTVEGFTDDFAYTVASSAPAETTAGTSVNRGIESDPFSVASGSNLYARNLSLIGDLTDIVRVNDSELPSVVIAKAPGGMTTVAKLPAASAALAGSLAVVSDANATTALSTVAGGGTNKVLVFCDGTNWVIA